MFCRIKSQLLSHPSCKVQSFTRWLLGILMVRFSLSISRQIKLSLASSKQMAQSKGFPSLQIAPWVWVSLQVWVDKVLPSPFGTWTNKRSTQSFRFLTTVMASPLFSSCLTSPFSLVRVKKTILWRCGSLRRVPLSLGFWRNAADMLSLLIKSDSMVVKMTLLTKVLETSYHVHRMELFVTSLCWTSSKVSIFLRKIFKRIPT